MVAWSPSMSERGPSGNGGAPKCCAIWGRYLTLSPERWLRVVVDFSEVPAFVATTFVQDNDPWGRT